MILAILMLMESVVPQALLDRSDQANAAYTSCLFGVTRDANARHLAPEEFERRLTISCRHEERELQQLGSQIFTLRGDWTPDAKVEALIRNIRRQMVEDYRKLPEQERALEELARVCRQAPDSCRP